MSEAHNLDLLEQLNPADAARFRDGTVHAMFSRLRDEAPVHYCADSPYGSFWSINSYELIKEVDQSHGAFSSSAHLGGIMIDDAIFVDGDSGFFLESFIAMDQPSHGPQRKAVSGIVAPDSLMNFSDLIRSRAQSTLDNLPVGEVFDWVPRVSIELTTQMLATLFDFPFEERHRLTRWSDVATAEADSPLIADQQQRIAELLECLEYFKTLRAERAQGPAHFDLLTMLAQDALTADQPDHQFLGTLLLLIVGGNDTTRNSMSGSVYAFDQFPEQFARLKAEPKLLHNAISEVIRWQTPLAHMRRTAATDVVIGGQQIRKGDKVVMWYASGTRDETMFPDAHSIDITRKNVRQHLSFGFGIHRCLGLRLGELQLKILWEEILKRWDRIEVVEPPERVFSNFINGYTSMMVKIYPK
ncbi:MAG: cytochrome P450 [Pseudomonadota bacterium]